MSERSFWGETAYLELKIIANKIKRQLKLPNVNKNSIFCQQILQKNHKNGNK